MPSRTALSASRSSRFGSFTTLHSLSKIIVGRVVRLKAGQFGRSGWFGLPWRAKGGPGRAHPVRERVAFLSGAGHRPGDVDVVEGERNVQRVVCDYPDRELAVRETLSVDPLLIRVLCPRDHEF